MKIFAIFISMISSALSRKKECTAAYSWCVMFRHLTKKTENYCYRKHCTKRNKKLRSKKNY